MDRVIENTYNRKEKAMSYFAARKNMGITEKAVGQRIKRTVTFDLYLKLEHLRQGLRHREENPGYVHTIYKK